MTNKITCCNNDCGLFRIKETLESILYLPVSDTDPSTLQCYIDSYFSDEELLQEARCDEGCSFIGKTKTMSAEFYKSIIVLELQILWPKIESIFIRKNGYIEN